MSKKIFTSVLFLLFLGIGSFSNQPSAAAYTCGVTTNRIESPAGAIVESKWIPYGSSTKRDSNNTTVVISDIDTRPDTDSGNFVKMYIDYRGWNMVAENRDVNSMEFYQFDNQCSVGDGRNVVLGYGTRSDPRSSPNTAGERRWVLDCDASQYGVGSERVYRFTGKGVPSGARSGGTWSVVDSRTPNGKTTLLTVEYTEPAPPTYILAPSVRLDSSDIASPGESIVFTPGVTNSGDSQASGIHWQINVLDVPSGVNVPSSSGGNSGSEPCTFYGAPGVNCSQPTLANGLLTDSTSTFQVGVRNFVQRSFEIGDIAPGTRLCMTLSVQPRSNDSGQWRHSAPICVTIGKKPKVQVLGGDLSVRGLVDTSNVVKSSLTYGSWVEYGIFSVGSVTRLASGSALSSVPNDGVAGSNSCNRSYLTFSNAVTVACSGSSPIGGFSNMASLPSVAASFPVTTGTNSINTAGVSNNSNTGLFKATSPLNINAINIPKGRWIVINASGTDVNINGDIVYSDGPFVDISEIPQVVIIANNINISGGVRRVDAWLIASNSINTCSEAPNGTQLTIATCNQQLQVNGPVISNHLYLQRTAGSGAGADSNTPAEIFNLRPDAYLWAYSQSKTTNLIRTVYTTALPPRL